VGRYSLAVQRAFPLNVLPEPSEPRELWTSTSLHILATLCSRKAYELVVLAEELVYGRVIGGCLRLYVRPLRSADCLFVVRH
jgi:hypothetical protein